MTEEAFDKWQIPSLDKRQNQNSAAEIQEQKKLGFDQGYQEGLAKAKEEINQELVALKELSNQIKSVESFVEAQTTELMVEFCERLILAFTLDAFQADKAVIQALIDKGISQLSDAKRVRVEISNTLYEKHHQSLAADLNDKGFSIEANANLQDAQIIVKSDSQTLKSDLQDMIHQHFSCESDLHD